VSDNSFTKNVARQAGALTVVKALVARSRGALAAPSHPPASPPLTQRGSGGGDGYARLNSSGGGRRGSGAVGWSPVAGAGMQGPAALDAAGRSAALQLQVRGAGVWMHCCTCGAAGLTTPPPPPAPLAPPPTSANQTYPPTP
jgi:hypothetical protein